MRKILIATLLLQIFIGCARQDKSILSSPQNVLEYELWYEQPATTWTEALPVGNGRMGAMVFGKVYNERIQVNEESLWSGKRFNTNNPNAFRDLPKIRELIFEGNIKEAHELGNKSLLGTPPRFRSHQTFGDIFLSFDSIAPFENYRRNLHLNHGISSTIFTIDGITYTREIFASSPDNVIVIHLKADKPGSISTTISLERKKDATIVAEPHRLIMTGQIKDTTTRAHGPGGENMKFASQLLALNTGGTIHTKNTNLEVSNADELTLLFTAATDYSLGKLNYDRSINPLTICKDILAKAEGTSYIQIRDTHINEHLTLFNRVKLDLGGIDLSDTPTDKRIIMVKDGGEDPALLALYFQYGRYLLMGSSRYPAVLPANLQGVWNEHFNAPWNADYHTNINLQMNYWPAEVCNLTETVDPLVNIVDKWREPGRQSAKEMYGCNGWMMHHATDIFGKTVPNADMRWGMSPLSGVWMTFPLWRHFEYTLDNEYLKTRAYPIMKEAMTFVTEFLIEKDGYLVTNPTMSPENAYIQEGKDYPCQLSYATTIDNQTLMAHIDNCIAASEILGVDENERERWKHIRSRIPPVKIGKDSTIMEWIKDYDEWEPGHRHMSHLLGLYPLAQITPETPDLFIAAKRTIEKRLQHGGGHTGWSRAWMINFFARLHESESAYKHLMALLRKSTLPNLFDHHPPFQIDGNFGGTAGIAEMLIQSHYGVIQLLPALPVAWPDGSVDGLCARGAFELDMKWANGELEYVKIYSKQGHPLKVKYQGQIKEFEPNRGAQLILDNSLQIIK